MSGSFLILCFSCPLGKAEHQIGGGIEDNSKIFFLFLNENICCDPSLEPFQRDGSNDGSQIMFYGEKWLIIPQVSPLVLLIGSTEKWHNFM